VTLAICDAQFTAALRALQQAYMDQSEILEPADCQARSAIERFTENAARLAGPVL
jgi:hypothetical protein